jgi:DNA-binding response OmpR family regulator
MVKLAVMTSSKSLFDSIHNCFMAEGCVCIHFDDDVQLARAMNREDFDAILLDSSAGLDPTRPLLARQACFADRAAPLIVVGEFPDRESIELAFSLGADEVVLSPIYYGELQVRTRLASRRFQMPRSLHGPDQTEFGAYRLDRRSGSVLISGEPVRLTAREFAVAWLLFSRHGEYVTRRQIAGIVWSSSEDIVGRTLEQHIYKLRKKLALGGANGAQLSTMYAHGYRIEAASQQPALDQPMKTTVEPEEIEEPEAPLAVNSNALWPHGRSMAYCGAD